MYKLIMILISFLALGCVDRKVNDYKFYFDENFINDVLIVFDHSDGASFYEKSGVFSTNIYSDSIILLSNKFDDNMANVLFYEIIHNDTTLISDKEIKSFTYIGSELCQSKFYKMLYVNLDKSLDSISMMFVDKRIDNLLNNFICD